MNLGEKDEIFAEANIAGRQSTGQTRHTVGGVPVHGETRLRIVRLSGDVNFYLIHYDEAGNELTDTCHESINEALEQAEFEYGLTSDEWSFFK